MGVFSWDCKSCEHPALSGMVTESLNGWMTDVVVLSENGDRVSGEYDGYGRVGDRDDSIGDYGDPCLYHRKCWEHRGKPAFDGPSRSSRDQGYFFDDNTHNSPPPGEHGFFKAGEPHHSILAPKPELINEDYVGNEEDGCYVKLYRLGGLKDGTMRCEVIVDSDTGHFVDTLDKFEGTDGDRVWSEGMEVAAMWCDDNGVDYREKDAE